MIRRLATACGHLFGVVRHWPRLVFNGFTIVLFGMLIQRMFSDNLKIGPGPSNAALAFMVGLAALAFTYAQALTANNDEAIRRRIIACGEKLALGAFYFLGSSASQYFVASKDFNRYFRSNDLTWESIKSALLCFGIILFFIGFAHGQAGAIGLMMTLHRRAKRWNVVKNDYDGDPNSRV